MSGDMEKWHFLIDANPPPRLCDFFRAQGYKASHLRDLGMERAADFDIWKQAYVEQAVIVTKDKDFASLAISRPDICPVIFLRVGNVRRGPLLAKFERVMQNLVHALDSGDKHIEIT
jgi:predicted nuclease of predicted toxin-antitoxin system